MLDVHLVKHAAYTRYPKPGKHEMYKMEASQSWIGVCDGQYILGSSQQTKSFASEAGQRCACTNYVLLCLLQMLSSKDGPNSWSVRNDMSTDAHSSKLLSCRQYVECWNAKSRRHDFWVVLQCHVVVIMVIVQVCCLPSVLYDIYGLQQIDT